MSSENPVAVITGGSIGIGRAAGALFARRGFTVVLSAPGGNVHAGLILPPLTRTNLAGDDLSIWDQVADALGNERTLSLV
jgi:NAD(P)-dependent dehydrogenase (short-subunit alcohol dehydrogenase family)